MPFVSVLTIIKLNNWNQSFYGYIFVTNDTAEQKLSITVNCEALRQLMQLIKKKEKLLSTRPKLASLLQAVLQCQNLCLKFLP